MEFRCLFQGDVSRLLGIRVWVTVSCECVEKCVEAENPNSSQIVRGWSHIPERKIAFELIELLTSSLSSFTYVLVVLKRHSYQTLESEEINNNNFVFPKKRFLTFSHVLTQTNQKKIFCCVCEFQLRELCVCVCVQLSSERQTAGA